MSGKRWTLVAAALLGLALLATSSPVSAADPSRGEPVYTRANASWARGEFDVAEALYHEALEQGGLNRNETLHSYVYMASARAVQGKREQAMSAFRQAVLIDPSFVLPSEAGKKAKVLGEQVRAREGRNGPFVMTALIPTRVSSGNAFAIGVQMDASRAALLTKVGLTVTSGMSGGAYEFEEDVPTPTGENTVKMKFDVPARMAMPGTEVHVKLAGLDPHDNELVTTEGHVTVAQGTGSAGIIAVTPTPDDPNNKPEKKKGGFWSSPIPYIIGGLILVGAGVGVYFATRPGDDVTLASVHVQQQ